LTGYEEEKERKTKEEKNNREGNANIRRILAQKPCLMPHKIPF
jgi:hypothetical protein